MQPSHPYAGYPYVALLTTPREPVWVEAWGCHVVARTIPGSLREDVAGAYPLCVIRRDADLTGGLEFLRGLGFVSIVLVADPFFSPPPSALADVFPTCRPFKTHHLVDYGAQEIRYSAHHVREVRRATRRSEVHEVHLADSLETWLRLYDVLVSRRAIVGPSAFSTAYFHGLASDDRFVATAALVDEVPASMHIWVRHEGVVYSHLAASSDVGYRVGASYCLYDDAIRRFAGARYLDLGGAAGTADAVHDGLGRFKAGFANSSAEAYLCGAILDRDAYVSLCEQDPPHQGEAYFPAYRRHRLGGK